MSNLVKDFDYVLDLAKFDESVEDLYDVVKGCIAKRAPPLAPPVFKEDLSTKTFTSPKADRETVGNLYEKEFDEKLGEATELEYGDLQWTDADVVKLCGAIATGKLVKLKEFLLYNHQIGDAGAAALAEVADKLVQLELLYLTTTRLATPALPRSRRWWASCRSSRNSTSAATRLATPALPRSRRWRASCRSSRNSTSATTPTSPSKPRTPSRPPCQTVM